MIESMRSRIGAAMHAPASFGTLSNMRLALLDNPTYEELLELEDVKVPTKAAILDRLPTHAHAGGAAVGDATCAVCMVDYEDGEEVMTLPCGGNKKHAFHSACIRRWLGEYSKKCPVCNFVLDE
jgi:hypothetical protein